MPSLRNILATSPHKKFNVAYNGTKSSTKLLTNRSVTGFLTAKENNIRSYSSRTDTCNQVHAAGESNRSDILPASKIPGLPSLPFFGSFFSIIFHKDFDRYRMHKLNESLGRTFGPIYKLSSPGVPPVVFFLRPEDVKQMLAETSANPIRSAFHALKSIRYNDNDFFQKKSGILSENHEEWKRVRSKVQSPIMKIQNITNYLSTMDEVALEFMDRIADMRNEQGEVPDTFITEMYKWALESVATIALNRRLGCLSKNLEADSYQMKLIESVGTFFISMQQLDYFPIWKYYPTKGYKKMKECHDYIVKIADENVRRAQEALKDEKPSNPQLTVLETYLLTEGLSRVDVTTFMTDLFIAGIDTTSHTVAFTLYLLTKYPDTQKTLQKEIDKVLGDGKSPITPGHLASLSYLKSCVKESLRLYPVAFGIARLFEKDTVINKYLIPKGWQGVSMNAFSGQDPSLFTQPKTFIPERWSKGKPFGAINPHASLPFSHGVRGCIGRRIAEQEIYTLLARICHRFNVEYHYEDLDPYLHVLLVPDKPLKFKFTERK